MACRTVEKDVKTKESSGNPLFAITYQRELKMTQEEVTIWEKDNMDNIIGWTIEYDVKPSSKIITFSMSDKSKVKFEVDAIAPNKINKH